MLSDSSWQTGEIAYPNGDPAADGSEWLLFALDSKPETYEQYAAEYFEVPISETSVHKIYGLTPLTDGIVKELNPELTLLDLSEDIEEIGYPVA
ncbi:MAG: hypothetical protein ABIO36_03370 [Pyrinomonadaceae bacterium]